MAQDRNWKNNDFDHMRPLSSFHVSFDEELQGAFGRRNTHFLLKRDRLKIISAKRN